MRHGNDDDVINISIININYKRTTTLIRKYTVVEIPMPIFFDINFH